jgi:hypothetical protein
MAWKSLWQLHSDKNHLLESRTHLDEQVFAKSQKHLAICARSYMKLTIAMI